MSQPAQSIVDADRHPKSTTANIFIRINNNNNCITGTSASGSSNNKRRKIEVDGDEAYNSNDSDDSASANDYKRFKLLSKIPAAAKFDVNGREMCKFFPRCQFGAACRYTHPPCRFGDRCARADQCPYAHEQQNICKFGTTCTNKMYCGKTHPDGAGVVPNRERFRWTAAKE